MVCAAEEDDALETGAAAAAAPEAGYAWNMDVVLDRRHPSSSSSCSGLHCVQRFILAAFQNSSSSKRKVKLPKTLQKGGPFEGGLPLGTQGDKKERQEARQEIATLTLSQKRKSSKLGSITGHLEKTLNSGDSHIIWQIGSKLASEDLD